MWQIARRRMRVAGALLSVLVASVLVPARVLASEPPWFLDPASEQAALIARLFNIELAVAVGVAVVIWSLILFVVVRYRARGDGTDQTPKQIHGNNALEITWTVGTAVVLLFIFVIFWQTMGALAATPAEAMEVNVYGKQWWWEFEYPGYTREGSSEPVRTGNELYIPVGVPVKFNLYSDNVIHSFWVPRLNGKTDVIPGQVNTTWFQADEPGEYYAQCAELCGVQHAGMRFKVYALPQEEWEAWIESQRKPAVEPSTELAQRGAQLFLARGCAGCHTIYGTNAAGRVGPDLTHFASRNTVAAVLPQTSSNVGLWVQNSDLVKPGNIMWQTMKNIPLSADEVEALTAYLLSLK
nr:cytochrome c oxidase subunit II [Ardenticatena sp.]